MRSFYTVDYSLIEKLGRSVADPISSRRLFRLRTITLSEPVNDELAFGRWLKSSNTLIAIIFRSFLSQNYYSNTLLSDSSVPSLFSFATLSAFLLRRR